LHDRLTVALECVSRLIADGTTERLDGPDGGNGDPSMRVAVGAGKLQQPPHTVTLAGRVRAVLVDQEPLRRHDVMVPRRPVGVATREQGHASRSTTEA